MTTHKILKTVRGSRDGCTLETFEEGSTHDVLPLALVEQLYEQGVIEEVAGKKNPAESRETKVTGPTETKEGEAGVPLETQHIEELNSVARDHLGLDTDTTMAPAEVREAIEGEQDTKGKRKK